MSGMMAYLGEDDGMGDVDYRSQADGNHDPERDAELDIEDDTLCAECGDELKARDDSRYCTGCRLQMLADLGR